MLHFMYLLMYQNEEKMPKFAAWQVRWLFVHACLRVFETKFYNAHAQSGTIMYMQSSNFSDSLRYL